MTPRRTHAVEARTGGVTSAATDTLAPRAPAASRTVVDGHANRANIATGATCVEVRPPSKAHSSR